MDHHIQKQNYFYVLLLYLFNGDKVLYIEIFWVNFNVIIRIRYSVIIPFSNIKRRILKQDTRVRDHASPSFSTRVRSWQIAVQLNTTSFLAPLAAENNGMFVEYFR